MNQHVRVATASRPAAMTAHTVLSALEDPIDDLRPSAVILQHLIETLLVGYTEDGEPIIRPEEGKLLDVKLTSDDLQMLEFTVAKIVGLATKLRHDHERLYEATLGPIPAAS